MKVTGTGKEDVPKRRNEYETLFNIKIGGAKFLSVITIPVLTAGTILEEIWKLTT